MADPRALRRELDEIHKTLYRLLKDAEEQPLSQFEETSGVRFSLGQRLKPRLEQTAQIRRLVKDMEAMCARFRDEAIYVYVAYAITNFADFYPGDGSEPRPNETEKQYRERRHWVAIDQARIIMNNAWMFVDPIHQDKERRISRKQVESIHQQVSQWPDEDRPEVPPGPPGLTVVGETEEGA